VQNDRESNDGGHCFQYAENPLPNDSNEEGLNVTIAIDGAFDLERLSWLSDPTANEVQCREDELDEDEELEADEDDEDLDDEDDDEEDDDFDDEDDGWEEVGEDDDDEEDEDDSEEEPE